MPRFGIAAALIVSLSSLTSGQQPEDPVRAYQFHQNLGPFTVDAVKGEYDESIVTLTYPSGKIVELNEHVNSAIKAAYIASSSRLILRSGGYWEHLAVIDTIAAAVVDEFRMTGGVASPTKRFIAGTPVVPRWAESSALYLIYDIEKSASENRMPHGFARLSDTGDRGWALYPPENVQKQTYETTQYADRPEAARFRPSAAVLRAMHRSASEIFWLSDHQVSFADVVDDVYTIVVVDVSGGPHAPISRTAVIGRGPIVGGFRIDKISVVGRQGESVELGLELRGISTPYRTHQVRVVVR